MPKQTNRLATVALLFASLVSLSSTDCAYGQSTENVFLITLDGLRWQELYTGADSLLLYNKKYVRDIDGLADMFGASSARERRQKLLPFFWSTIAAEGQLYGNRTLGSKVDLTNNQWFSYPGYNEILVGFADSTIDSNDKVDNHNVTVLEHMNRLPEFAGKVAAFGSWDVFPYIVNERRSGIPVNAGFEPAQEYYLTDSEKYLNKLQTQIPSPWATVRFDAFTHQYAVERLKKHRTRLLYIAYGETDDFAHDQDYEAYLKSAHQTDKFIAELWNWAQSKDAYRNKTTFVITTDHGRGFGDEWSGHGTSVKGADHIWFAVIGPDTASLGEKRSGQLYQNQIASTVARFLGVTHPDDRVGEPVQSMFQN